MSPKGIVLIVVLIGLVFLGLLLFPTTHTVVDGWATDIMPSLSLNATEEWLVKFMPYAGLGLFILLAIWMIRGGASND